MKHYLNFSIVLLTAVLVSVKASAQGADCASAAAFCSGSTTTFPASTSTTAEAGPDYGCLFDQPNPAWYFLQIDNGGNLDISLTNSSGIDIDFICWGPFPDQATACANLTGGDPFDPCTLFGTYPCGNIVDCSFDVATSEEVNIAGALPGEVYMLMITNYDGLPTDISASTLPGSTGTTDCSIVPPPGCYFDYLATNSHDCDPDYNFTISGDFSFVDNPGTGQIVVEVNDGTNILTQTFNPPFVDGQLYHFDIGGVDGNGLTSTVTVYFTDDPTCTFDLEAPNLDCGSCVAEIGTFTPSAPDEGTPDYVLCYGETLDILSNGDFVPPGEVIPDDPSDPAYDPGYGWLVYSCPPSVGVTPSLTEGPGDDPCFQAIWGFGDLSEINDQYWMTALPAGTFTDNIVYFVPLTFYDMSSATYSNVSEGTLPCYELGTPISVQYLPEVTSNLVEDCGAGTVTVTLNGGAPELLGTQFTNRPGKPFAGNRFVCKYVVRRRRVDRRAGTGRG